MASRRWRSRAGVWSHDDVYIDRVLPSLSVTGYLQCPWCQCCYVRHRWGAGDLVEKSKGYSVWNRHLGFINRWGHFPDHGESPYASRWIWLDYANCRIYHSAWSSFPNGDNSIEQSPCTNSIQHPELRHPVQGREIRSSLLCLDPFRLRIVPPI